MKYDIGAGFWKLIEKQSKISNTMLDGISVSEKNNILTLEALTPLINPKTIKVSFRNGFLKISAEKISGN